MHSSVSHPAAGGLRPAGLRSPTLSTNLPLTTNLSLKREVVLRRISLRAAAMRAQTPTPQNVAHAQVIIFHCSVPRSKPARRIFFLGLSQKYRDIALILKGHAGSTASNKSLKGFTLRSPLNALH